MHEHKTKAGKIIHTIGLFFHNIFGGKVTPDLIKAYAEDIAKIANVYNEVAAETKDITDPALKVTAICQSILNHAHELPNDIGSGDLVAYVTDLCQKLTDLPLAEIEAIVTAEFHKK